MTTIIAGKDADGKIHILGDNCGSTKSRRYEIKSKILDLGNAKVGIAGPLSVLLAVNEIAKGYELKFGSVSETFEAVNTIYSVLQSEYEFDVGEDGVFNYTMLITTATSIYEVLNGRDVVECPLYGAIGSGAMYACGALEALSNPDEKVSDDLLHYVMHIVSSLDPHTDFICDDHSYDDEEDESNNQSAVRH